MKSNPTYTPSPYLLVNQGRAGKLSNAISLSACLTLAIGFGSTAQAEWRVGTELAQVQYDTTISLQLNNSNISGIRDSENDGQTIGIFMQYRHPIGHNWFIGGHLGFTPFDDSKEWRQVRSEPSRFAPTVTGNDSADIRYEPGYSYDLLGIVGYHWGKITPFLLAGYTTIELEQDDTNSALSIALVGNTFSRAEFQTQDQLQGWKVGLGAEMPLNNKVFAHVAVQYADYDEEVISLRGSGGALSRNDPFELSQTSVRVGVSYSF